MSIWEIKKKQGSLKDLNKENTGRCLQRNGSRNEEMKVKQLLFLIISLGKLNVLLSYKQVQLCKNKNYQGLQQRYNMLILCLQSQYPV